MKTADLLRMVLRDLVPFKPHIRRLKRRLRPYEDDPANSDLCVTQGLRQIAALRQAGAPIHGTEVLEFGSGWMPLIPLLFDLAGARQLLMTDIERLMDAHTTARAKQIIAGRLAEVAAQLDVPAAALQARLDAEFRPDYQVPWQPAAQPASSVDIILSRATFEHVPVDSLRYFLGEFQRILRPGGWMCHVVDNSDHWQHRDRSLSRVDFLRYAADDWRWRLAQRNQQAFQNRLRHSDYIGLFQDAGFTVEQAVGEPDAKCLRDLQQLPLAPQFAGRAPADLAVLTSLFVLRKPTDGTVKQ